MAYLPGAISVCCAVVTVHDECKAIPERVVRRVESIQVAHTNAPEAQACQ